MLNLCGLDRALHLAATAVAIGAIQFRERAGDYTTANGLELSRKRQFELPSYAILFD